MKWLNIITDTADGTKPFSRILYELYSSEKDLELYSGSTGRISRLLDEKMNTFNENSIKLQKLVKKLKKKDSEVYSYIPDPDSPAFMFKAVEPKAESIVEELNKALVYIEPLRNYMYSSYVFKESDYEKMPELNEIVIPAERFVYDIPFAAETSWDKLKVPEALRHQFTVAMAMQRIQEEIV